MKLFKSKTLKRVLVLSLVVLTLSAIVLPASASTDIALTRRNINEAILFDTQSNQTYIKVWCNGYRFNPKLYTYDSQTWLSQPMTPDVNDVGHTLYFYQTVDPNGWGKAARAYFGYTPAERNSGANVTVRIATTPGELGGW